MSQAMTPEIRDLRQRFREFIDGEVIPAEPALYEENPVRGPPSRGSRRRRSARGLWAIGHPKEIGGGGLPFMPFVFLNEIVGRSHWGQICVGTRDHAGLDHAQPLRQRRAEQALPRAAGGRRHRPLGRPHRARGGRLRSHADARDGRPRRRRVGDQRAQVVHHQRQHRRVHHRLLPRPTRKRPTSTASSPRSSCPPTRRATRSCAWCRPWATPAAATARSA